MNSTTSPAATDPPEPVMTAVVPEMAQVKVQSVVEVVRSLMRKTVEAVAAA
jgi:hypothetical protein